MRGQRPPLKLGGVPQIISSPGLWCGPMFVANEPFVADFGSFAAAKSTVNSQFSCSVAIRKSKKQQLTIYRESQVINIGTDQLPKNLGIKHLS